MSATLFTLVLAITQLPPIPARADAAAVRARADVERSAREFRRTVYENFRTDRDDFDRRWQAGEELYHQWTTLRQPALHRDAVAGWFAEAAWASSAGQGLPPLPHLPEPSVPASRTDRGPWLETITPPAPVTPRGDAEEPAEAAEDDNPYLPVLPDDDVAPAPPEPQGKGSTGAIHDLLNLGGALFGGPQSGK